MNRRITVVPALLFLAACVSPLKQGRQEYFEAMYWLDQDPAVALKHFQHAETALAQAMAEGDLDSGEVVTATAVRVRSLIELNRHAEAASLLKTQPEGFDPGKRYLGDKLALMLIRLRSLDPERAYAALLKAERVADTPHTRLHLAWQEAKLLVEIGTPKARAEARKLCDQNPGKLDFDELKKSE